MQHDFDSALPYLEEGIKAYIQCILKASKNPALVAVCAACGTANLEKWARKGIKNLRRSHAARQLGYYRQLRDMAYAHKIEEVRSIAKYDQLIKQAAGKEQLVRLLIAERAKHLENMELWKKVEQLNKISAAKWEKIHEWLGKKL